MKKTIWILCCILLITGCNKTTYKTITQEEAKTKIENEEAILIDVRTIWEYNENHIDGAISMPVDTLDETVQKQIEKDTPVIVYCRSGSRSKIAAEGLIDLGYKKVYDLGSIDNWKTE